MGFVGIFELGVAMIECIQSSGWTGYMLMKVWHNLLEVGFVKANIPWSCHQGMMYDEFIKAMGEVTMHLVILCLII